MKLLPALTTPTGGGAVRGIGEKFSANPATGSASLTIPIATPPGRGGFTLGLQLTYDSGAGNGPFGVGMRLSVPAITRKTDRGLPRYIDDGVEADLFVLSGAEDLVPVLALVDVPVTAGGRAYRVTTYRPRVEAEFARIQRWRGDDPGDTHWRATTRDNITSFYGVDADSRVSDPRDPARIFTWLLARTEDDRGNVVEYGYRREDAAGLDLSRPSEASRVRRERDDTGAPVARFVTDAQRYLKTIRYGNSPHVPGQFAFQVVLDYGEHDGDTPEPDDPARWHVRPDSFSTYRSGFEIRTYRRCRRVLVFHRFPELGRDPYLVRSTELVYDDSPFLSMLTKVVQKAHVAGAPPESLPALELSYTAVELHDRVEHLDADAQVGMEAGLDPRGDHWIDLDGEGLPGVLRAAGGIWHYKRNLGHTELAAPAAVTSLPAVRDLASADVQLQDLGGDGALDVVTLQRGHEGYYARRLDGTFAPHRPFRSLPVLDWHDPNLSLVDLDGDGAPEILITDDEALIWYPSLGKEGYGPPRRVARPRDDELGPALVFADGTESVHLADLSGDGLVDLVRVRHGNVCYWPNLGHGHFGAKVIMKSAPAPGAATYFDPRRVRFADLDGSGPADYFYLQDDGAVLLARNQAGNGWDAAVTIATLPPANALGSVDLVDLRGNGTTCLVWSARGAAAPPAVAFVDLLGGVKPHLLTTVLNHMGGRTDLGYLPSTEFYRRDRAAGRPWLTRLPFPVQCLARVAHHDLVDDHRLVTEYRYHHGHFDGHEREFAGFACVEQLDAETFIGVADPAAVATSHHAASPVVRDGAIVLPPARTVTWFHTGAYVEADRLERALQAEYFLGAGAAWLLPDTVVPDGLSAGDAREAARALRGRPLRQELYADDGSPAAAVPYTVTEYAYAVVAVPGETARHRVFHVHGTETIRMHLERRAHDARIEHDVVVRVDDFGNVRESVRCAYPRASAMQVADAPEQARGFIAVTEHDVWNQAGTGAYRLGVPLATRVHELHGFALPADRPVRAADLRVALAAARAPGVTVIPYEDERAARALPPGPRLRLVHAVRHGYWTDDLAAVSWSAGGTRALHAEVQTLALTPGLIARVFAPVPTAQTLADAGYAADGDGQWASTGRVHYDATRFFLPHRAFDPFGNPPYEIDHDRHALLVVESRDPFGNRTRIVLDPAAPATPAALRGAESPYRTLSPTAMLDANDHGVAVAYDGFGRVVALAHTGGGDTLAAPSARFAYHLDAPVPYSYAAVRERSGDPASRWQERYLYVDGLGREAMTKVRAEPGLAHARVGGALARDAADRPAPPVWTTHRWVGTGRTVYDNKGHAVRRYEPYFSSTEAYEREPELVEIGVSPILRYDPVGRQIETLRPDGAVARVVFDAWTRTTWDENDAVLDERAEGPPRDTRWLRDREGPGASVDDTRAASQARRHARTPTVVHLDALGRPVVVIADNGVAQPDGTVIHDPHVTRTDLDLDGQALRVTDARGIVVLEQVLDLGGRTLRSVSPDAGTRTVFWDAVGRLVEAVDADGIRAHHDFDRLRRPTRVWVTEPGSDAILRTITVYGESLPAAAAIAGNLRTRPWRVYDGAGTLTTTYTYKGLPETVERRLPIARIGAPDWRAFDVSEAAAGALLDGDPLVSGFAYDALDRVATERHPDGSTTEHGYNEAGFLETVITTPRGASAIHVLGGAEYNARGQRIAADVGGPGDALLRIEHDHDPLTSRMTRIVTWKPTAAERAQRAPGQPLDRPPDAERYLQDLRYAFDPVGNIVAIRDAARPGIIRGHGIPSADCEYEHDAVYRLVRATGREHPGQVPRAGEPAAGAIPHAHDLQALRRYVERYTYDAGGNLRSMQHAGAAAWALDYRYEGDDGQAPRSNRLLWTGCGNQGADTATGYYAHDRRGQMTKMPGIEQLRWSWDQRLAEVERPGVVAHYQYDAAGNRVRKHVQYGATGPIVEQVYVGNFERRRRTVHGATTVLERLRVGDDQVAVSLIERRDGGAAEIYYQLGNHLGSGTVEVDAAGEVSTYGEYTPWGRAAFQVTRGRERRLRFNGKERDDETGLHYYGARYYSSWLGRWTACDPAGFIDGTCLYAYATNAPVRYRDRTGEAGEEPLNQTKVIRSFLEAIQQAYIDGGDDFLDKHPNAPAIPVGNAADAALKTRIAATDKTARFDMPVQRGVSGNPKNFDARIFIPADGDALATVIEVEAGNSAETHGSASNPDPKVAAARRLARVDGSIIGVVNRAETSFRAFVRLSPGQLKYLQEWTEKFRSATTTTVNALKNLANDESGQLNLTKLGNLAGEGVSFAKRALPEVPRLLGRYIGLLGAFEQAQKTERHWIDRGTWPPLAGAYGVTAGALGIVAIPVDLAWMAEMGAQGAESTITYQYKRYGSGPMQQIVGNAMRAFTADE